MKTYYMGAHQPNHPVRTMYPHTLTLRPGVVFPTKFMSTNAVHYTLCPKCGAEPTFLCVTPSGKRGRGLTGGAHTERIAAFVRSHPDLAQLSIITAQK